MLASTSAKCPMPRLSAACYNPRNRHFDDQVRQMQYRNMQLSDYDDVNSNQLGRDFWSRRGWHHRAEIEMYSFINGDNQNA